jgi:hypothetical protein
VGGGWALEIKTFYIKSPINQRSIGSFMYKSCNGNAVNLNHKTC